MPKLDEHTHLLRQNATLTLRLMELLIYDLDDPAKSAHSWRIERAETVAALRGLCRECGDNDWDDALHLADVVEKHLANHLLSRNEVDETPKEQECMKIKDMLLWAFINVHSSDNDILGAYAHYGFDLLPDGCISFTDEEDQKLLDSLNELRGDR